MRQTQNVQYYQAKGIGDLVASTSPIVAAARTLNSPTLKPNQSLQGWADDGGWGMLGVIAVGLIVATGALSYQAGKAMAPSKIDAKTWGWIGVPVGLFTGPWGLGVMGIISNSKTGK